MKIFVVGDAYKKLGVHNLVISGYVTIHSKK